MTLGVREGAGGTTTSPLPHAPYARRRDARAREATHKGRHTMTTESDQAWMRLGTARMRLHQALDSAARNGMRLPREVADALAEADRAMRTWTDEVEVAEAEESSDVSPTDAARAYHAEEPGGE